MTSLVLRERESMHAHGETQKVRQHAPPRLPSCEELVVRLLPRDDARVSACSHEEEDDAERWEEATEEVLVKVRIAEGHHPCRLTHLKTMITA